MATAPVLRRAFSLPPFARFLCVGTSGYAVNLATFAAVLGTGAGHRLAATAAFLLAVTNNFVWSRRWTFTDGAAAAVGPAAARFLAVAGLGFVVSLVLLDLGVRLGAPAVLAQATSIVMVMPLSYRLNRTWTFRRATEPSCAC